MSQAFPGQQRSKPGKRRQSVQDRERDIEESGKESFPASDPPAYSAVTRSGAPAARKSTTRPTAGAGR